MENSTKNVLVAAGTGLAVGTVLGVLFAPAKGEETRKAIKNKVSGIDPLALLQDLKDKVETKYEHEKSEVKDDLIAQIQELEKVIDKA